MSKRTRLRDFWILLRSNITVISRPFLATSFAERWSDSTLHQISPARGSAHETWFLLRSSDERLSGQIQTSFCLDYERLIGALESSLAPGPYHRELSEPSRTQTLMESFDIHRFQVWLGSRSVFELATDDPRSNSLQAAIMEA